MACFALSEKTGMGDGNVTMGGGCRTGWQWGAAALLAWIIAVSFLGGAEDDGCVGRLC